jgi:hypothetical protein
MFLDFTIKRSIFIDHIIFFDLILKTTIRSIKMYDSEFERVTSFKLLGTWFDDNLKWDSNTEYIAKKARKRLYFLKLLKRYGAPTQDLLQFYCSIIRSTLEYGDVLWHGRLTNSQSANNERIYRKEHSE